MADTVYFQFYGSLNDFFPAGRKGAVIPYTFTRGQTVKDAIEALGVPHPEVYVVLKNQTAVPFNYRLSKDDILEVFPKSNLVHPGANGHHTPIRFVLDVHVGKLAKALRMLGFDSLYENDYTDKMIASLAHAEDRSVLTRDIGLLKQKIISNGYWLRSQNLEEQLKEVIDHFQLQGEFKPLSRCLVCNSTLIEVDKASVLEILEPKTKAYFHEFYQCKQCKRVYWKGSHYERMMTFIRRFL